MVIKMFGLIFTLGAVLISSVCADEESKIREMTFDHCFLYEDADGRVWLGQQAIALGMIGVIAMPPVRLSAELAEKLQPLVNKIDDVPESREFWWSRFPRLHDSSKPIVLLCLEVRMRPLDNGPPATLETQPLYPPEPPEPPKAYEVVSAEVISAEFASREWINAWLALDKELREIVAISRTAPGPEKRKKLAQSMEKASQEFNFIARPKIPEQAPDMLRGVEPKARIVRSYQRSLTKAWGYPLYDWATLLRIEPQTPLPEKAKACPLLELLAKSKSAADFLAEIEQSHGEEQLEERLLYSDTLRRVVYVWQVADITPAQFEDIRAKAAEIESQRRGYEARAKSTEEPAADAARTIPEWGVVLRPASNDLLAEKCLLRAAVVEKVLPEVPGVGLQAGDLIINYSRVYDLIMGKDLTFTSAKIEVLRGDKIFVIERGKSNSR